MSYLGNQPAANFASVTKDTFSGDGSTVAFTLSKAATTNGVAVFVENVRQEPTTAYAVSGTTLTFTAAPVSASGNNIYVLHHNAPASTATHPAAQDLTAVNGTLTGTLAVAGDVAIDTDTLFVDVSQDNVGINTNAVDSDVALEVNGNVAFKNGSNYSLYADVDGALTAYHNGTAAIATASGGGVTVANGLTLTDGDITVASGHGIDFSATANTSTSGASMSSELFDYYEEGTWTPTAYGGTTAGSFSATTVAGFYTRIGRIVHGEIRISSGSLSSAAGTMQFGGLPFAIGGTGYACSGSFAINTVDFDPSTIPVMQFGASTNFYFLVSQDDTGWTTLNVSNFDSTFTFIGTFIYQV